MKPSSLSELLVMTRGNLTAAAEFVGHNRYTIASIAKRKDPTSIVYIDGEPVLLAPIKKRGNAQ